MVQEALHQHNPGGGRSPIFTLPEGSSAQVPPLLQNKEELVSAPSEYKALGGSGGGYS